MDGPFPFLLPCLRWIFFLLLERLVRNFLVIDIYIWTTSYNQCWVVLYFFVGEPPGSVPSYYYFLKEPQGKVLILIFLKIQNLQLRSMFFLNMGGSQVLGFNFLAGVN